MTFTLSARQVASASALDCDSSTCARISLSRIHARILAKVLSRHTQIVCYGMVDDSVITSAIVRGVSRPT